MDYAKLHSKLIIYQNGRRMKFVHLKSEIAFQKSCFEWKLYAGQHEICHPASLSNIEVANLSRIFTYLKWKQLKFFYRFLGLQTLVLSLAKVDKECE